MKILFMGTPDFAVGILSRLKEDRRYELTVITQEDKPKGRGYKLSPPPVKEYALEHGIPVYQPSTLRGAEFASLLESLAPSLIVVAAYGKILPPNVIEYPKYGCINVHGSLLPKYRGAAPIERAIINGETETGITIMQMDAGLDTGDILYTLRTEITPEDNLETLFNRLSALGAEALMTSLKMLEAGTLKPVRQDDSLSCYAAKIEKSDCILDFSRSAKEIHNRIRGLSPVPLAYSVLNGNIIKIVSAHISDKTPDGAVPGMVIAAGNEITVACGDGCIAVTEVLPAGKKRMSAADFVRGRGICRGDVLQ